MLLGTHSVRFIRLTVSVVLFAVLLTVLSNMGCNQEGYPYENTWHIQGKAPSHAPKPSTFAYRYPDVVPVLDAPGMQDFVSKYRHQVVVLDFWASWSRQNREELEMLARLQSDLRDQGFQVIACNLDGEAEWARTTVPILHGAGGNFPCVIIPPDAKAEIRSWLAPDWDYDIPARFVINRSGRVVMQAYADTPLSAVEQQVRDLVRGGPGRDDGQIASNEIGVRLKLINVAAGQGESIGQAVAMSSDPDELAERAADLIAGQLDRSRNPRIAICPFSPMPGKAPAGPLGVELANRVSTKLKDKGFFDQIEPARAESMVESSGQSVVKIEYDPSVAQGRLSADYLVIGWLRGDVGAADSNASLAGTTDEEQMSIADE